MVREVGQRGGEEESGSASQVWLDVMKTTVFQILGSAHGVSGVASIELPDIFRLPKIGHFNNWNPLTLDLVDGEFADFLGSNLGCRLCSDRLKSILDSHASVDDDIQWLPVVVQQTTLKKTYSILHFPNPPDILHKNKTIFLDDFVVKPVLSADAIGQHKVFSYPRGGELPLFITQSVKEAIDREGCTGMEIALASVA